MKRAVDWRARLSAAIEARRRLAYAPGTHDCALFAADCILAMTGEDLAGPFRGRYRTPLGGGRALRKAGHADLAAFAAAHLTEIAPARATAGDVAVIATPDGWALGIVVGERITVLMPAGLGVLPRTAATRAFRVG